MIPGEIIAGDTTVAINKGLKTKKINVINKGDRPIQVGSHFHFFEVNRYLKFDRQQVYGYRLDIPSGTAIRFEPNAKKEVDLVEIEGNKKVKGLNNLTDSQINNTTLANSLNNAELKGFIVN